jgi:hypothetical protein
MTARIIRPLTGRIEVHGLRAPRGIEPPNREMFRTAADAAIRPSWEPPAPGKPGWHGHWTIYRHHLTTVAEAIAIRDGQVEIEMHYSQTEQCDRRCQRATGDDCTCSCEGHHHGEANHATWIEVGETTLVRGTGTKVVTRVLTRQQAVENQRRRS